MRFDNQEAISSLRRAATKRVVRPILDPLTRPRGLETLRLIAKSGRGGTDRRELEAIYGPDEGSHLDLLLSELIAVRAVSAMPDSNDGRKRRYHPNLRTPEMLAIGDGLIKWVESGPFTAKHALSTEAAKLPLRLATTLWAEGVVQALHRRQLTVDEIAVRLDFSSARTRHMVDRAARQGLLRKTQGPGGLNFISTAPFFSSLVPTAARATLYMARAFKQSPECFRAFDLRVALAEVLNSVSLDRPLDVGIALRVFAFAGEDILLVATFRRGVLVEHAAGGDYTAKIESDLPGWLELLSKGNSSQVNIAGRGARSLLQAIEAIAEV